MSAQTFRLDVASSSVLIICTLCGSRELVLGRHLPRATVWAIAAAHERRAHPGSVHASTNLTKSRARRVGAAPR